MNHIVKSLLLFLVFSFLLVSGCQNNITIMSYNIHHGAGTDKKFDLDRIASIIKKESADIVTLNEVDNNFETGRSEFTNTAAVLAEKLNMEYAYGANLVTGNLDNPSEYGNAILTKHKIISSKNHRLYRHANEEPRGCLHANISVGNNVYNVFTTHLDCSREHLIRQNQAKDICRLIAGKNNVIFTGDLNSTEDQDDGPVTLIKKKLLDSYDIINKDPNQGTIKNGKRIDYIFVCPGFENEVLEYRVIRNSITDIASDHWPIVIKMKQ